MPYVPPPNLTSQTLADSAGGAVARAIAAAPGAYSQAGQNDVRSSLVDAYATLRAHASAVVGKRGGGYRPIASVNALAVASVAANSTTIQSANAGVHDQANEDAFRYNFGRQVNALAADVSALKAASAPRPTFTRLTYGGAAGADNNISAAGAVYNVGGEADVRVEFVTKLNAIADALGV